MSILSTGWGEFAPVRFPVRHDDPLRGWDAADEYLLRHLDKEPPGASVAVLGDRWGALTLAVSAHPAVRSVVQISDSHLGQEATRAGLGLAGRDAAGLTLASTVDPVPERADTLLVRVPKSLDFLEDQLRRLGPALHPGSVVVGSGMVREIHTSTLEVFERVIGPTRTSLAVRKARLIFSVRNEARASGSLWPLTYSLPDGIGVMSGRPVVNHAGIFCSDRLDIGTRLLLEHLPVRPGLQRIIDLGCGNGVVGTAAALANPGSAVLFTDESHHAVASAEATFRANLGDQRAASFVVGDCLADAAPESADLVLCNPPFHVHAATTDDVAWRMFKNARRALAPGGELRVVANRHLGYHSKLRYLFGNCAPVAGNRKFVVLSATRR
jgi:16S rRNA (guanine1207-N2)-methyltransferase